MALRNLQIQLSYRTGRDDLVRGFFIPCLEESTLYRRSAGYFSSAGLALAARGVASLVVHGGEMRLVVSPVLQQEDVEALRKAMSEPTGILKSIVSRSLFDIEEAIVRDRLNALAWLAATGHLKIKLALCVDESGDVMRGIYHEKVGVFSDENGDSVAFSGSVNETAGGFVENFESFDVFRSWHDSEGRVQEKISDFDNLWADLTPGLRVFEFSKVARELLDAFRDDSNLPPGFEKLVIRELDEKECFRMPSWLDLRDYQLEAIKSWSKNGGTGIFAMATGSGKTLTALALASKVADKNKPFVLIVICPFINLCKQWIREMYNFGLRPIACYEGRRLWESQLEAGYQRISVGLSNVHTLVVSNSTFLTDGFQRRIQSRLRVVHHLIIADEVHNLGASKIQQILPDQIKLRLGLSATPERHHDPEGTQGILDYFGKIVFEYPIERAIAEGRLCRYYYYPHIVQLNEDESIQYQVITEKVGRLMRHNEENLEIGQSVMRLLIKRARLLASAKNKITVLDEVLRGLPEKPSKAIFYCGDGSTKEDISKEEVRQIEIVTRLLGETHGLRVRNFTYREKTADREAILSDLSGGYLDGVVAIRCLDEGIDIPDVRVGFLLASSTNPRQFVQRRGRLLRNSPGKAFAHIHDFIIEPPDFGGSWSDDAFNLERSFFKRELIRIQEFCNSAENGQYALNSLKPLRLKYNLIGS